MNDKKPTNDTELIAALWGMVRHLQRRIHEINCQSWALDSFAKQSNNANIIKIAQNITEYTECIYESEKADDGTVYFETPTDILEQAAVRLVEHGWTKHWSDYVGWDERSNDFAESARGIIARLGSAYKKGGE